MRIDGSTLTARPAPQTFRTVETVAPLEHAGENVPPGSIGTVISRSHDEVEILLYSPRDIIVTADSGQIKGR